jgi:hypothetical protein
LSTKIWRDRWNVSNVGHSDALNNAEAYTITLYRMVAKYNASYVQWICEIIVMLSVSAHEEAKVVNGNSSKKGHSDAHPSTLYKMTVK